MGKQARVTRADVEHVAMLARLALTADEIEQLTGELSAIVEYAAEVSALDTADVPPTAHPLPLVNVFRPDDPQPGLDRDEVLAEAPAAEEGQFRVPRILGEEP
jgi:aspartyl-tRNA(Asn)/glutamyl-tRNA(Gln) amidotransferase subunit C